MKKLALATAIALSLGANIQVFALSSTLFPTILFDRDGSDPGDPTPISVTGLNWLADSLLAQGLVHTEVVTGTATNTLNDSFTLYGQGRLANFSSIDCGGSTCAPFPGSEFTFTFAVSMMLTPPLPGSNPTAFTAAYDPTGGTSTFSMYYNKPKIASEPDGTDYDTGTLILQASFAPTTFDNLSFSFDNITDLRKLDSFNSDEWNGSDAARPSSGGLGLGAGTYPGSGKLLFDLESITTDPNGTSFFKGPDLTGMDLSGNVRTPFQDIDPSALVSNQTPDLGIDTKSGVFTGGTGPAAGGTRLMSDFSCLNNGGPEGTRDCDFMMQTDGPAPDQVPEPTSLALLGLGLSGLAALRRRKRV